jgi:AcrR family transcriptional regulator
MSKPLPRKKRPPARRAYHSPLRANLTEETRRRILEAALAEMEAAGPNGFSVPRVAQRADMALRTVYRHFPTRDELVDAMWLFSYGQYDWILDVDSAAGLPAAVAAGGRQSGQRQALLEAALRCPRQIALRDRTRQQRMDHVAKMLAPQVAGLTPVARRRVLGVLHGLATPSFWHVLQISWCPDPGEAADAAAWAVRVILAELARRPAATAASRAAGRDKSDAG